MPDRSKPKAYTLEVLDRCRFWAQRLASDCEARGALRGVVSNSARERGWLAAREFLRALDDLTKGLPT